MSEKDLLNGIARLLRPIRNKIRNVCSRAVIGLVDDGKKMQEVQLSILALEIQDEIERMQEFGFSSVPLPGAEALVLFVSAVRDHAVVIATDDRNFRPLNKTPGSSRIYDILGSEFALDADGKAKVFAPVVELGSGTVREKILNGETFQITFNTHLHTVFGITTTPPNAPSLPIDLSLSVSAAKLPV